MNLNDDAALEITELPTQSLQLAQQHIASLTGDEDYKVLIQAYDDLDIRDRVVDEKGQLRFVRRNPRPHLIAQFYGPISQNWDAICQINNEGAGIAILINEHNPDGNYEDRFGNIKSNQFNCTKSNMLFARSLFQEADDKEAKVLFPLAPTLVIQTSPRKFHRYWGIDGMTDELEKWEAMQRQMVFEYGSDPSAKDVSRRLRLAGTLHMKNPNYPHLVQIVSRIPDVYYPFEALVQAFPPIEAFKKIQPKRVIGRDGQEAEEYGVIDGLPIDPEKLVELGSALTAIDADSRYQSWLIVLMGLHHISGGGKDGFELACEWSTSVANCATRNQIAGKWETFSVRDDGITEATIFQMALANGWVKPQQKLEAIDLKPIKLPNQKIIEVIESEYFEDEKPDGSENEEVEGKRDFATKALYEARRIKRAQIRPTKNMRPTIRNVPKNILVRDGDKTLMVLRAGLYYHYVMIPKSRGDEEKKEVLVDDYLCSPLEVIATTKDVYNSNYGTYLKFKPKFGPPKYWAMPSSFAMEDGVEFRRYLATEGWQCSQKRSDRALILDYINNANPGVVRICTDAVGWVDCKFGEPRTYVLPNQTFGAKKGEIVFQTHHHIIDGRATKGSFEVWQLEVSRFGQVNPLLVLSVCGALAGIVLEPAKAEGGGINLLGASSTGKSTLLRVGASLFGDWKKFANSWSTTENGLEGLACTKNDGCIFLDEIGKSDARAVNNIAYALANGIGRQRAGRDGQARVVKHWRTFVISTGEKSLESILASINVDAMGGQVVRLPSIACARKFGVWDDLLEFGSGKELSDYFKSVVSENYGHASLKFIEAMCDDRQDFESAFTKLKNDARFTHSEPEASRVGSKFALLAFTGELAIAYKIIDWKAGTAIAAAKIFFDEWCSTRPQGSTEITTWLNNLQEFLQTYADNHFTGVDETDHHNNPVKSKADRYGWIASPTETYLLAPAFREALGGLKGADFTRARNQMIDLGILNKPGGPNKNGITKRIFSKNIDVYVIDLENLSIALHGEKKQPLYAPKEYGEL